MVKCPCLLWFPTIFDRSKLAYFQPPCPSLGICEKCRFLPLSISYFSPSSAYHLSGVFHTEVQSPADATAYCLFSFCHFVDHRHKVCHVLMLCQIFLQDILKIHLLHNAPSSGENDKQLRTCHLCKRLDPIHIPILLSHHTYPPWLSPLKTVS